MKGVENKQEYVIRRMFQAVFITYVDYSVQVHYANRWRGETLVSILFLDFSSIIRTEMSDEEAEVINERDHNALLRDIRQLDRSQKRRAPAVTKPTKKRTTFDKAAVLDDLVGEITSTRWVFCTCCIYDSLQKRVWIEKAVCFDG